MACSHGGRQTWVSSQWVTASGTHQRRRQAPIVSGARNKVASWPLPPQHPASSSVSQLLFPSFWLTSVSHWSAPQLLAPGEFIVRFFFSAPSTQGWAPIQAWSTFPKAPPDVLLPGSTFHRQKWFPDAPDNLRVKDFQQGTSRALPIPLLPLANSLSLVLAACHLLCQPNHFHFFLPQLQLGLRPSKDC